MGIKLGLYLLLHACFQLGLGFGALYHEGVDGGNDYEGEHGDAGHNFTLDAAAEEGANQSWTYTETYAPQLAMPHMILVASGTTRRGTLLQALE